MLGLLMLQDYTGLLTSVYFLCIYLYETDKYILNMKTSFNIL